MILRGHGRVFIQGVVVGTIGYSIDVAHDVGARPASAVAWASTISDALARARLSGAELEINGTRIPFHISHYDESTSRLVLPEWPAELL